MVQRQGWDTFEIETPPVPDFLPEIDIVEERRRGADYMTLAEVSIGNSGVFNSYPIAFDTEGNIRWYIDLSSFNGITFPIRILNNGNICFGRESTLYEYDWLGIERNQWTIEGYSQHHEILELPNGNFIVAVDKFSVGTVEDHMIEVDRESGAIVREWDLRENLDVDRFDLIENEEDWFHMNAIAYDSRDQTLVVSGRHQGVVKLTMDDELVWIMAPQKGWGRAGVDGQGHETSDYLLEAISSEGIPYAHAVQNGTENASDFEWVWGQHAPMLLSNGNWFIFDNGDRRNFEDVLSYSRGVEYSIDKEEGTITQVWEYGSERGTELYSPIISDVDVTDEQSRVITSGIIQENEPMARIVEVDHPDKDVLFEAKITFKNALSNGSISWGNFDLLYRSERFRFDD